MSDSNDKDQNDLKLNIARLFNQLHKGCGNYLCSNASYCRSSINFNPLESANACAAKALSIFQSIEKSASKPTVIARLWCDGKKDFKVFDFSKLEARIEAASKDEVGFTPLIRELGNVFSSPESFVLSLSVPLSLFSSLKEASAEDDENTPPPSSSAISGSNGDKEKRKHTFDRLEVIFRLLSHEKISRICFNALGRMLNSLAHSPRPLSQTVCCLLLAAHSSAPNDFMSSLAGSVSKTLLILRSLYSFLEELPNATLAALAACFQNCLSIRAASLTDHEQQGHPHGAICRDQLCLGLSRLLAALYRLNELRTPHSFIAYDSFVNEIVSSGADLPENYRNWMIISQILSPSPTASPAKAKEQSSSSSSSSSAAGAAGATSTTSLSSSSVPLFDENFLPSVVNAVPQLRYIAEKRVFFADFGQHEFSLLHFPFLLDTEMKSQILQIESFIQQRRLRDQAIRNFMLGHLTDAQMEGGGGAPDLHCTLKITRSNLMETSLNAISRVSPPSNLRKKLNIVFEHEEAQDEGGVKKEWFQLLFEEIFNPIFGMFEVRQNHLYWFRSTSREYLHFNLLGTLLGLSIYNGVILDLHFPQVVYKQLLDLPLNFSDFAQLFPELAQGFKQMLEYDGDDFDEVYERHFEHEYEEFGEPNRQELCPGGSNIALCKQNRHAYVALYAKYLLITAVKDQMSAFKRGFDLVLQSSDAFHRFRWEELELLICGSEELDFNALKENVRYEGGYDADHLVIKHFWEVFDELDLEQKKRLLHFATGSSRAPIGGLGKIRMVIMKHGESDERLPSASTCFDHLLLPPYDSKEKLREKLLAAIENAQGFGML